MRVKEALSYLKKNEKLNIGMIQVIKRGTADILYANIDGVLLIDRKSKSCMLSVDRFQLGKELIDTVKECNLVMLHQEFMLDYARDKFDLPEEMICYTAIYEDTKKFDVSDELEIKLLDESYIDIVMKYYKVLPKEAIMEVINGKSLFGGFKDGQLVGFIGNHQEGTIGLLEIVREFRRRGYATLLYHFMINRALDKGVLAFAHIDVENEESIELHKKLGLEVTKEKIFWLF